MCRIRSIYTPVVALPSTGITRIVSLNSACLLAGLTILSASGAQAGRVENTDCLPPLDGTYASEPGIHQQWTVAIENGSTAHSQFTSCASPPSTGTSTHSFGSTLDFTLSTDGGVTFTPEHVPGVNVTVAVTFDHQTGNTRFFDTEMTQLDVKGGTLPPNVEIEIDPTRPTLGQTTIEGLGGGPLAGPFLINSFFDVFTELSLDGGVTFIPSLTSGRVSLVPEPSAALLLVLGLTGLLAARRIRPVDLDHTGF